MSIDVEKTIEVAKNMVEMAAVIAGGVWFIRQNQRKQRIQFDLECDFFHHASRPLIAEIRFVFENRGYVEHRLFDLTVSVQGLDENWSAEGHREKPFTKSLVAKVGIVPRKYGYFFVRPGVRQVITHQLVLPSNVLPIIQVTAGFNYTKDGQYPHTARRVFKVPPPSENSQSHS
jgi:hypothetical protein